MKLKKLFVTATLALGLGVGAVAGISANKGATEADAALDSTYVYFKTPWNNDTSDVHVWNTNEDANDLPLVKVTNYLWKIERSSISGYANFIVRGNAGKWEDDKKTADLKYSVFAKSDYVTVYAGGGADRWALLRNTNSWAEDENYAFTFNEDDLSEVKLTNVNFSEGVKFKVVKIYNNGTNDVTPYDYYGYASPLNKSAESDASHFTNDGDDNIVALEDGTYSLFFNVAGGNNSLWITDADKVAIDGWATGFIGVTDFCDVGDVDWDIWAGNFAALSEKAQGYFNDATANASGSNIQKAASRYDNAVTNHGKTPFAGGSRATSNMVFNGAFEAKSTNILPVFVITLVAATLGTVGFFFLRKKKQY